MLIGKSKITIGTSNILIRTRVVLIRKSKITIRTANILIRTSNILICRASIPIVTQKIGFTFLKTININFKKNECMKKVKVLLDFIRLVIAEKITFYRSVLSSLTDNDTFPSPDAPLTEAKAAVDALENSSIAAKDGSRTAISIMHDNEEKADTVFRTLAAYVERIAAGDETKILSSGFHISKQPTPIQKAALTAYDGANSGCVKLVAKAVDKAGAYIWQMAKDTLPENGSQWINLGTSTQSNFELSGLVIASKYYFRVAAVTPDGTSDCCAPVMKVVV